MSPIISVVRRRARLHLVVIGLCLVQGCATHAPRPTSLVEASCLGGIPRDADADVGPTELVLRKGYVLEHSAADKIPLWVCESVGAAQLGGHVARHDAFKADPILLGAKAYPDDYAGSGYDRGHQAAAGNQTRDPLLKSETFYLSNMEPQRPSLNRGIWTMLEEQTRAWVREYGHAYEWTGPIRCGQRLRAATPAQQHCQRRTIGKDAVAVPVGFYKIIVVQEQGAWKAIAFVMPNTDTQCPCRLEPYITSIDRIERETGIEFMPALAASVRRALKTSPAALWP
jgi:endonuclease G